ncbi:MAG TPA: hypothetical protein VF701_02820 [Thermoanaerobaculia bacterium]
MIMNDRPLILLAGRQVDAIVQPLIDAGFAVRLLTRDSTAGSSAERIELAEGGLAEASTIRRAARGCSGALAAPAAVNEAGNIIRVLAGTEVELLVIAGEKYRETLQKYARDLGSDPVFIAAETITSSIELFRRELMY